MPSDNQPVREILAKIIENGSISAGQVRELEQLVRQDWVIDSDEVEFLFRINHSLGTEGDTCLEWSEFFTTSVCRLVVMDMNTPGQIDESEGDWLEGMFRQFSVDNASEKKLIAELKKTTTSIAGKLAQRFESR